MKQDLFEEFTTAHFAQWKTQVEAELRGKSADSLSTAISEGREIEPYLTERVENSAPLARPSNVAGDWCITDELMVEDEKKANGAALKALNGGANGILYYLYPTAHAKELLQGIDLPYVHSHFVVEGRADEWAEKLLEIEGVRQAEVCINMDPIENLARSGAWFESEPLDFGRLTKLAKMAPESWKIFPVNGATYAYAGATATQQLGILLASTHENFVQCGEKALLQCQWNVAVGTDYLEEIAKLRAARKLFALLSHHLHGKTSKVFLHAESSALLCLPVDQESNMLRNSAMAMAAVSGGADSVVIRSHNGSESGTRLARNIQLLLRHESYFSQVSDVAAGSFFLEKYTEQLAEEAWRYFKKIEGQGGIVKYITTGELTNDLEQSAQKAILHFEEGKTPLIGLNKYLPKGHSSGYKLQWQEAVKGISIKPLEWKKLED